MASRGVQAEGSISTTASEAHTYATLAAKRPASQRQMAAAGTGGLTWSFSRIPANSVTHDGQFATRSDFATPSLPWPIQAKLEVGPVDDPLEREADQVAERVMRMSDPTAVTTGNSHNVLRRKCACGGSTDGGGGCEECRKEREDAVQRFAAQDATVEAVPPIVHEVLHSPGQPLDSTTRVFMESRLNSDFSRVRIHADSYAAESARALSAHAYTAGHHIVFASGRFASQTPAGRQLLAHELVHVRQQNTTATAATIQRQSEVASVHSGPAAGEGDLSALAGIPIEKWSQTIEQQYRARGDMTRANAVHACRAQGTDACAWIISAAESESLYALAQESGGDESKIRVGLASAAPLIARELPRVATRVPLRLVPPPAPEPVPAPLLGTAAGLAAIAALAVLEVYALSKRGEFQEKLRENGFIILEDPLALCVGGCHMPSQPSHAPLGDFPPLAPEQIEDWLRPEDSKTRPTQSLQGPTQQQSPQQAPQSAPKIKRGSWTCDAQCNVQQIKPGAPCPDRVNGTGTGPNQEEACRTAKRAATQATPPGCYPRHCRCFNCVKN